MIADSRLRADCARCCGLCCVAPSFDADQGFGFDKPAHAPCLHLRHDDRCRIHDALRARGFPACAAFDCHGAGQWVTQHLFGGQSWRTSPQIAAEMFRAYAQYRSLHESLALMQLALARMAPADAAGVVRCMEDLDAICRAPQLALTTNLGALRNRVRELLRALRKTNH